MELVFVRAHSPRLCYARPDLFRQWGEAFVSKVAKEGAVGLQRLSEIFEEVGSENLWFVEDGARALSLHLADFRLVYARDLRVLSLPMRDATEAESTALMAFSNSTSEDLLVVKCLYTVVEI